MSPKILSPHACVAALGLIGSTFLCARAADEAPAPPGTATLPPRAPATLPAPAGARVLAAPAQVPNPQQAPASSVLLLNNGRVIQGQLSREDDSYVLKQKLGVIRFPKRQVERVFGSIE